MDKQVDQSDFFRDFKNSTEYEVFSKTPVAYFCSEYALDSTLPTYAGGLGILSGDYIREIAKQGFPLVAIGLRYQRGQSILPGDGINNKSSMKKVLDENNQEVIVTVPIEHRTVSIKVWLWGEGNARVYLLDTDIDENDPHDREITKNLYDQNRDIRLKQEIVLGIGGFRLLARLKYHASVYHLNEGHSAFLALELIRHEMEHQRVGFFEACVYAKRHILFTNHTLALAGQEQFLPSKVDMFIEPCARDICLNNEEISKLGALENHPNIFSMTTFSFRISSKSNAVSEFHYQNAKKIWPDQAMEIVTNGIFIDRWDGVKNTSVENIWDAHQKNKRRLLTFINEKTGEVWAETDLIFVWAKRLVKYKQPLFFLENIDKLIEISKNSPVPIRVIFSGPTSSQENPLEEDIKRIIMEKLQGMALFIPEYSIDLAKILTTGADIWLNTPIIGTEACGTSGMKAALNGALALSTDDGWVNEVNHEDIGWVINNSENSVEMYNIIQDKIIPTYFDHLKSPENSVWVKKMMSARRLILERFSTTRMLKEYIEKLYIPIMKQKHMHKVE